MGFLVAATILLISEQVFSKLREKTKVSASEPVSICGGAKNSKRLVDKQS